MKIICTQENLRNGLSMVSRVVSSSNTLPILNNVLIETNNGGLQLTTTNLEIGISTRIRCKVEDEGSVCVSAKTLMDLVNNLPSDNITIESEELEVKISTGNYLTKIKHFPVDDFPSIPKVEGGVKVGIEPKDFKAGIESVLFSVSSSETQPEISGVCMSVKKDKVTFAATDRYRLAERVVPLKSGSEKKIIIPSKSLLEVSRLLDTDNEIELSISDTQLSLTVGDSYLVTRLIEGQYPDYEQIIPLEHNLIAEIEKAPFLSALKTSSIFSKGAGSITIAFDSKKQTMQISSVAVELGESVIDVPCSIQGDDCSVIMNYRYVQDMVGGVDAKTVTVYIINESSPVVFKTDNNKDYLYLVMPIRL